MNKSYIKIMLQHAVLYSIVLHSNREVTAATIMIDIPVYQEKIVNKDQCLLSNHNVFSMMLEMIQKYLYHKQEEEKVEVITTPVMIMSREEAFAALKDLTSRIFDPDDQEHISLHLNQMKNIAQYLDPIIDMKTIDAIDCLLKNQHRSSFLDALFWKKMIKEKELDTTIPMHPDIAIKNWFEKSLILRKKLAAPIPTENT